MNAELEGKSGDVMFAQPSVTIIAAIVGAAVTMIGWFITDTLRRRDIRRTRLLDHLNTQIVELYAPLYALAITESGYRKLRDDACQAAPDSRRSDVWNACTEDYVAPTQRAIHNLLNAKWHLLEAHEIPESFTKVLDHCSRALLLYELDRRGVASLLSVAAEPMPNDFERDVGLILSRLRSEHRRCLGKAP